MANLREKVINITEHESHPVVLVGNKCDLESDRQIKKEAAEALARQYGWKFLEGSAKAKINVTETFIEIVRSIRSFRAGGTYSTHALFPSFSLQSGDDDSSDDASGEAGTNDRKTKAKKPRRGLCLLL